MKQRHPYCRTCGSQIHSTDVCNYCGCAPQAGHNYCCDCGTSTIAEAIMCVHCGASFQSKFPATLAALISIAIVITLAGGTYFLSQGGTELSERNNEAISSEKINDSTKLYKITPAKPNESIKTITNNIPAKLLNNRNDAITRLVKNLPKNLHQESGEKILIPKNKEEPATQPSEKISTTGSVHMNTFSSGEMKNYAAGCTYFEGRSKKNIVFFTTNVYGYVKINGKIYALQGVQKGNDIARFSGAGYEVTIEIEGLAGNENEWMAEATMVVKDVRQKTLSHHKIYSTCTDF